MFVPAVPAIPFHDCNRYSSSRGAAWKRSSPHLLACRIILAICLGIGTANAIGWMLDVPALVSPFDRFPKMVPATSALVLANTARLRLQIDAPAWRRTASLLGALIGAAGVFIPACYLADRAPPVLLLSSQVKDGAARADGRPAAVTAQPGRLFFQDTLLYAAVPGKGESLPTALAAIRSAAEALRYLREPDTTQIGKVSATILRQADHMAHLVDDLMDVARIGRGQLVLAAGPVAVPAAIADAYEQVRPIIERKRHGYQLDFLPEPVTVIGDHKRLVQVIANLLNNAAKYTPQGGALTLRLRADARQVEIAVQDNGAGIDAALLPTLFDTFTQAALTPDRREGGLGLGLALVKRLTELHGGTVRAESAGLGHGSTFTVSLPRAETGAPTGSEPG